MCVGCTGRRERVPSGIQGDAPGNPRAFEAQRTEDIAHVAVERKPGLRARLLANPAAQGKQQLNESERQ